MAAICGNAECTDHGVKYWDSAIPAGEPISCGRCGQLVDRTDEQLPAPWEQHAATQPAELD